MMLATKQSLRVKLFKYATYAYTLGITFLLLFPSVETPQIDVPSVDKVGHGTVFIGLVVLWGLFLVVKANTTSVKIYKVLIGAFIYGIVIEAIQGLFIPSRTADGWDLFANVIGILLGWFIFLQIKKVFVLKS